MSTPRPAPRAAIAALLLAIPILTSCSDDPPAGPAEIELETPEHLMAAWEEALKDEDFASDRGARYLWWYRRTPHWDETQGLMPAMCLRGRPDFRTEPWPGAAP